MIKKHFLCNINQIMMKFFQYIVTLISWLKNPQKRHLISLSRGLKDKTGLEVGGPSGFFSLKSPFPVYIFAKRIDGVNFSTETVWEGTIREGFNYDYAAGKKGYQYICEASELTGVPKNKYDFLLSCHSLEHIANPVKALQNWNKVLNQMGKIILVLPDKNYTFDNKRPYTTFEHLLEDYHNDVGENDTTHFDETITTFDFSKDPNVTNTQDLERRVRNNFVNRCVHHHVYNFELLEKLLIHTGFKVLYTQKFPPFHLVVAGEKIADL